ncbi:MAG: AI-2E family transporter [Planctomyces sp.]|nr:AI-2E family transporter [Planctomyces sp.]
MSNSQQLSFDYLRSIYILLFTCVVFAVLFFAREVLIPIMLSVLIAFVVSPLMFRLERMGMNRMWAMLCTSGLVFLFLGGLTWISANQLWVLVGEIPAYKQNLMTRVAALRPSGQGKLSQALATIDQVENSLESGPSPTDLPVETRSGASSLSEAGGKPSPVPIDVRVVETAQSAVEQLGVWVNPLLGPIGTAGLVVVLVMFILLDIEDLHDRFVRLTGDAALPRSNIAIDDAIARVSGYIQMTFLINAIYGVTISIGLALIGIPNAVLWGVLGTVLRFVPYLGPMLIFLMPLALSLAATSTWLAPGLTLLLFVVLELVLNNIIEPWLYGRSTGVSSMGIILASIFWAWVWGPVGLILATPLTVILVVIGRHFPQLQFMTTLFAEKDAFLPHDELFQRLLIDDSAEAENISTRFGAGRTLQEVCDELYLPVLTLVENHRKMKRVTDNSAESMCRAVVQLAKTCETSDFQINSSTPVVRNEQPVVLVPERHTEDLAASELIQHVLQYRGYECQITGAGILTGELSEMLVSSRTEIVVLSSIGGGRSALFMSIARRLSRAGHTVALICGLWNCIEIREKESEFFRSAGITKTVSNAKQLLMELEVIHQQLKAEHRRPVVSAT